MIKPDDFVALVAVGLGVVLVFSGLTNNARCFEIRTPKMLSQAIGRSGARMVLVLVGTLMIALGYHISFKPGSSRLAPIPSRSADSAVSVQVN